MLNLALFFLAISIITGIFGFGGIAETGAEIAQLGFFVFLGLFLILSIVGRKEFANYDPKTPKVDNTEDYTRTTFF
jgi:uncharacterized membrane protein YtjA (UPF0391 family)